MTIHWVILILVPVLVAQRLLFRYLGMRKLSYERAFSVRSCFEGERIEMIERIRNEKRLPVPWLRVESQLRSGLLFGGGDNLDVSSGSLYQNHASLFSLGGRRQITRRHQVRCAKRGVYRLTSAAISSGDLFGLFRAWRTVSLNAELTVYPLPAERSELGLPAHSWQGDVAVRRWIMEDPFLVSGVRTYQNGDPLKNVNWGATARTGTLQVRKHDYTADYRLAVLLNVEDHAGMWQAVTDTELIEHGIRKAAGLMQLAEEQGLAFGFASNGHDLDDPARHIATSRAAGREHLIHVLDAMARLVVHRCVPFEALLGDVLADEEERCDIVVVSAFWSEAIEEAAALLRQRGHQVNWLPIEAPADEEADLS
ncbi:DUF58 domain-containing protein [Paenibacillus methanolicus]|uniref:Uncharacterized protein DUF58 n=1 Tax=Paenibacillus methanolicus TaxID=582686 RepID=A0A5S5BZX7_9BACL|nr:DUF58 domain-containing protein [Paenibacillus methanolicus]TYP72499.1 uncharacterized protein DUF58 [Paenibacillus methanolicus]